MTLSEIAVTALMSVSNLLHVGAVPKNPDTNWQTTQPWQEQDGINDYSAKSTTIAENCGKNPNSYLEFPAIIHAAQYVFLDGKLVYQFGDKTFESFQSFYGAPVVPCSILQNGTLIEWHAYSYSKYFARFNFFPRL